MQTPASNQCDLMGSDPSTACDVCCIGWCSVYIDLRNVPSMDNIKCIN
jgi:hypothetical protein